MAPRGHQGLGFRGWGLGSGASGCWCFHLQGLERLKCWGIQGHAARAAPALARAAGPVGGRPGWERALDSCHAVPALHLTCAGAAGLVGGRLG